MTKKIPEIPARNALSFNQRLKLAKINRIKLGLDSRMISDIRLTDALAKDEDFEKVMQKLERKPRKETLLWEK